MHNDELTAKKCKHQGQWKATSEYPYQTTRCIHCGEELMRKTPLTATHREGR